jgi:hypothetical protein
MKWQREYLAWAEASIEPPPPPKPHPMIERARLRRQVIFDLHLYGCKLKDIAAYAGCSVPRVKNIITRERRDINQQKETS